MGVSHAQVERSRAIQRRTGRTFYLATKFLPERVREPTHVLYAFFRIADEIVDGDETDAATQRSGLEDLRAAVLDEGTPDDTVVAAFAAVRSEHGIPDRDVATFLDAMAADVSRSRYESYEELERYMDGSAAAVGRMMTRIMDPEDAEAALPHATALGEAFQLTNFIRDVREDALDLDRVYLPETTLQRYGTGAADVAALDGGVGVRRAVAAELQRAEQLYREGVAGIRLLPEDCRLAVTVAAVLYAEHHRVVRARDYDVLSRRATLSRRRKLVATLKALVAWRRAGGDPEETFYRASCVDEDPDGVEPRELVDGPPAPGRARTVRDRLSPDAVGGKISVLLGR